jgi:hypothetical protein
MSSAYPKHEKASFVVKPPENQIHAVKARPAVSRFG